MKKFFSALIGAAMVFLGSINAEANDDTYTCDAFAEHFTDAFGARSVVRKTWTNVTYKISPLAQHKRSKPASVLVFYSGDSDLDNLYRQTAPIFAGPVTIQFIMERMKEQPLNIVLALARSKNVNAPKNVLSQPPLRSQAICWDNKNPPPDRSSWPVSISSGRYCAGVIWYRRPDGEDLTPLTPIWGTIKNVPGSNKTDAETHFRRRLLSKMPDDGRISFDANLGIPSGDVQVCWQGKPPTSAPMGWPEEKRPWASVTSNPESYVAW